MTIFKSSREIKAQYIFERETSAMKFPNLQDGSFGSNFKLGCYEYLSLLRYRRAYLDVSTMHVILNAML